MSWFIDTNTISNYFPVIVKPDISFSNICCDNKMKMINENGNKTFICIICGKYIETSESFNNINEFEKKISNEKKKYGLSNEKVNKSLISNLLSKIQINFQISESAIINIIKNYNDLRARQIFRGKKKDAIIIMCIVKNTSIPVNTLTSIFNVKQRHLTDAHKLIQYELAPFDNTSIKEYCDGLFKELIHLKIYLNLEPNIYQFIIKLMVISVVYYIGHDRRLGTLFYSIIYYLQNTGDIKYDCDLIFKAVHIQKNTIYKYYDMLLIYLNCKEMVGGTTENFIYRHMQLVEFFTEEKIKILPLYNESRLEKYKKIYVF